MATSMVDLPAPEMASAEGMHCEAAAGRPESERRRGEITGPWYYRTKSAGAANPRLIGTGAGHLLVSSGARGNDHRPGRQGRIRWRSIECGRAAVDADRHVGSAHRGGLVGDVLIGVVVNRSDIGIVRDRFVVGDRTGISRGRVSRIRV